MMAPQQMQALIEGGPWRLAWTEAKAAGVPFVTFLGWLLANGPALLTKITELIAMFKTAPLGGSGDGVTY